jgi:hypothetical protein
LSIAEIREERPEGSDWKKYMHLNTSEGYFFQSYGAEKLAKG